MRRSVVISQPMYFPWVGLFEQMRLADTFVHYDDVQMARGFFNRVQIKTQHGSRWMTVPLRERHRGQLINETLIDNRIDWRQQHRNLLTQTYNRAPCFKDMLRVLDEVFARDFHFLSDLSIASVEACADFFGLTPGPLLVRSHELNVGGSSSERLCEIVRSLRGTNYITGHGARNYLDHSLFEHRGIRVLYMDYQQIPYPQLHGGFTPFVSILDLIANCGKEGSKVICSSTLDWRAALAAA